MLMTYDTKHFVTLIFIINLVVFAHVLFSIALFGKCRRMIF